MADWLSPILGPLGKATDTLKGLVDIRDTIKFGEAVAHLHGQLLSAYGAIEAKTHEAAMLEENRRLKQRVAELDEWQTEKQRYKLNRLEPGILIYTLKPDMADGEPPHNICANCYRDRKKSILQVESKGGGFIRGDLPLSFSSTWS